MLNRIVRFALEYRVIVLVLAAVLIGYGAMWRRGSSWMCFRSSCSRRSRSRRKRPASRRSRSRRWSRGPWKTPSTARASWSPCAPNPSRGCPSSPPFSRKARIFSPRGRCWRKSWRRPPASFPDHVKAPKMSALTSSTMDLLKIGLTSKTLSPLELRTFADWTVRPRLLAVPGVARLHRLRRRGAADSDPGAPRAAARLRSHHLRCVDGGEERQRSARRRFCGIGHPAAPAPNRRAIAHRRGGGKHRRDAARGRQRAAARRGHRRRGRGAEIRRRADHGRAGRAASPRPASSARTRWK